MAISQTSPRPYVVAASGDAQDAPAGAVPINLYGAGDGGAVITPQPAPAVDPAPADTTAVAADLQALVTALVAAGVLTQ